MAAFPHFERGVGNGERHTHPPVTGAVHPDALIAIHLHDVHGARGRAFGFRIQRHARPKTRIENQLNSVFLDVIDDAAFRFDALVALEHVDDQPRSLEFVFEMRGVNQNHLIMPCREVHVHFQHLHFVARILVQPDFTDAEHVGLVEEFWDQGDDIRGQRDVLGLLGVDAQPCEMRQAKFRGPLRLVLGQLAEVIVKTIGG